MVCELAVQQNLVNMEDNWNPDEWQGRSKKNVEDAFTAIGYTSIFFLIVAVIAIILDALK